MGLSELARMAADELGAAIESDEGVYFLTVGVADEEGDDDETPTQIVMLNADDPGALVFASCDVGVVDDDVEWAPILRELSDVDYCRIYLEEGDAEDDEEHLIVKATVPLAGLESPTLAEVVQEVADVSAWLCDLLDADEE